VRQAGSFATSVFINCPFDRDYWPMFEAIVFTIVGCGFRPRCALEELDSGTVRLDKIRKIIGSCLYGVHDLSRVELSASRKLPRFNMPFELGLDIAAKAFGTPPLARKRFLILDAKPYRYQKFISDISGQDIRWHQNRPSKAINVTRSWLRAASGRTSMRGPVEIKHQFVEFGRQLPENCKRLGLNRKDLLFVEYVELATQWVDTAP
jgi:hypothetical protein